MGSAPTSHPQLKGRLFYLLDGGHVLIYPGHALDLWAARQQALPPVWRLQQLLPDVHPPAMMVAWMYMSAASSA